MSEAPAQAPQPNILATINPDEAAMLHNLEVNDPRSLEIREKLGALTLEGGERAYALVVGKDEQGKDVPMHYVDVTEHDAGTRIKPQNNEKWGLPDPADAYAKFQDAAEKPEEEVQTSTKLASTETQEQQMESNNFSFTREQIELVDGYVADLPQQLAQGTAEPYVRDVMTYASGRYHNKVDADKSLFFTVSAVSAGALPPNAGLMSSVVEVLQKDETLSGEDKNVMLGFLDQVKRLQQPGLPADQIVNRVLELSAHTMATLADYERAGKDIDNLRIGLAAIVTGATAWSPYGAVDRKQTFANLLMHHAKSHSSKTELTN